MNDKGILGGVLRRLGGECQFCHCHGESCKLPDGDLCIWADDLRTRCNAEACQAAYGFKKRRQKEALRRGRKLRQRGRAA